MSEVKKQLLFIHGGNAFSDPRKHEELLKLIEIEDPFYEETEEKIRWYYAAQLQESLGPQWQIMRPDMPDKQHAQYAHWQIWFEKYVPFLQDGCVLMGHSLGAMFLTRYLSENTLPVSVSKLFLVSGAFTRSTEDELEDGEYFYTHLDNMSTLEQSAEQIYIVHSEDDFVVPYSHAEQWVEHLPSAQLVSFTDRNHFLQEQFLEIIELVQT